MQLTAESFQQMLDALALAPVDLRKRRSSRRIPIRADVIVSQSDGGTATGAVLEITVTNASPGGLGFTCHADVEPGVELLLYLPSRQGHPVTLRCEVLHCEPTPGGAFQVGARFLASVR